MCIIYMYIMYVNYVWDLQILFVFQLMINVAQIISLTAKFLYNQTLIWYNITNQKSAFENFK